MLGILTDFFVYCALVIYPSHSIQDAYYGGCHYLHDRGIDPQYARYLDVYHAMEAVREAPPDHQRILLKEIGIPKYIKEGHKL